MAESWVRSKGTDHMNRRRDFEVCSLGNSFIQDNVRENSQVVGVQER